MATCFLHNDIKLALRLPVVRSFLHSGYLDLAILFMNGRITQLEGVGLVWLGNHLVEGEGCRSDQLLFLQIMQLIHVVSVVDLEEEVLALFEMIVHIDGLDEFGVQVVEDALCLPNLLSLLPFQLPKHAEWITLRRSVKIGQIFA